jgi:hypothetical protein
MNLSLLIPDDLYISKYYPNEKIKQILEILVLEVRLI